MTLRLLGRILGHLLFWGWNLSFLAVFALGLGPVVLWQLLGAVVAGLIPWSFAAFAGLLLALPVASVGLGAWKLRSDPGRLLSLLYGVEGPLLLLCLLRLFAFGPLTAPTALGLLCAAVGTLGLLRTLLSGFEERRPALQALRLAAQTVWATVLVWGAAWLALGVVPLAPLAARGAIGALTEPRWLWSLDLDDLRLLALVPVLLSFYAFNAAMFAVYPVAAVGVGLRAWQVVHRATAARLGRRIARGVTAGSALGVLVGFAWASRQPQAGAFALLDAATDDAGRRAALAASGTIREGLVAARLGPQRLLDLDPEGREVGELWSEAVHPALAAPASAAWRLLLRPFTYQPVSGAEGSGSRGWGEPADVAMATAAYGSFFDAPMEVAEREALLDAARRTWDPGQAHAGLLAVGDRRVRLAAQAIEVRPAGDVAVVTVHDEYRNLTFDPQEVLVSFSLPESAAVTGLWLGSTPRREEAFRFVVAPRGAAQEVYEAQVRVRRDPALVEQVGPRQYRLRAFPVPPRDSDLEHVWTAPVEGEPMHLWLELVVPAVESPEGAPVVPLPEVAELRHLTLIDAGPRTLDGVPFQADGWMPPAPPALDAAPRAHRVRLGDQDLLALPAAPSAPRRWERLAVLVDGTRSMAAHAEAVDAALERLRQVADRVEPWCVVEDQPRPCPEFRADQALFYGSVALEVRLAALAPRLEPGLPLVVLTDRGSYELAAAAERAGLPEVELPETWLVHLDGLPAAYPDWTLDRLLRSGGGAAASVEELLARRAQPGRADGWTFSLVPADPTLPAEEGPFSKIAARRAVALIDAASGDHDPAALDRLHALAVRQEVVTPWSSLLVLVDEAQRRALAAAEQGEDRFDREVIDGPPEVSSVPEPPAALLLGVGGAGLALAGRRRRGAASGPGPRA